MSALLDVRLGCIKSSNSLTRSKEADDLIKAAQDTNVTILGTDMGLQLWRKFNTPLYKQLMSGQDIIYRTVFKYIDAKDKELRESDEKRDRSETVLEHFLLKSELRMRDIVTVICDLVLAGVDTGSFMLSYALYNLATNPEKQKIVADEVSGLLKQSGGEVTHRVLAGARYLKAVMKETYRLRPVSIGVGRIIANDTVIRGYKIPKNTVVVTQNQVSCRLGEYFNNPDAFIPERWFTRDDINPFLVLPFGHGPRACIGRRMAEQNLYTALILLVAHYNIGWIGGSLGCYSNLINEPDAPLDFTFTPRNE
ncbi:hypothetical protein SK128_019802 [Halocaridina rubra]|uniref:Cytochrome P450 302a1, mitochondrial n=1 Tax=Halocaridina rubra TaxID=373956 RepID=A0AAN8ZT84_HALRR